MLKKAGSCLGFKHSEKTLDMFRNKRIISEETRKNLSLAAQNRVLTETDKRKISASRLGVKLSNETRAILSAAVTKFSGIPVLVKDINTGLVTKYSNLTEAAKTLEVSRTAVKKALDLNKILKKT